MAENKCPKCGGVLEEGFIADWDVGGYSKAKFGKNLKWSGMKIEGMHDIVTYRCTACGYLENYAK